MQNHSPTTNPCHLHSYRPLLWGIFFISLAFSLRVLGWRAEVVHVVRKEASRQRRLRVRPRGQRGRWCLRLCTGGRTNLWKTVGLPEWGSYIRGRKDGEDGCRLQRSSWVKWYPCGGTQVSSRVDGRPKPIRNFLFQKHNNVLVNCTEDGRI